MPKDKFTEGDFIEIFDSRMEPCEDSQFKFNNFEIGKIQKLFDKYGNIRILIEEEYGLTEAGKARLIPFNDKILKEAYLFNYNNFNNNINNYDFNDLINISVRLCEINNIKPLWRVMYSFMEENNIRKTDKLQKTFLPEYYNYLTNGENILN